jgi:transcription initiation factor TFIIIB Brf1 subunit/transcription initiation factor TFIIB
MKLRLFNFTVQVNQRHDDVQIFRLVVSNQTHQQPYKIKDIAPTLRIQRSPIQLIYHFSRNELADIVAVIDLNKRIANQLLLNRVEVHHTIDQLLECHRITTKFQQLRVHYKENKTV